MASNMTWLDLEQQGEIDNSKLVEQIENELHMLSAREREEDDVYAKKKEEMLKDASDRDKEIFKNVLSKVNQGQNQFNKEMNNEIMETDGITVNPE